MKQAEATGPGFINIYLAKGFVQNELKKMVFNGVKPPYVGSSKRVIIDFSSPNIAKGLTILLELIRILNFNISNNY